MSNDHNVQRELIVSVGTSLLTSWMTSLDPDLRLPTAWVGRHRAARDDAPEPDARAWLPRLLDQLAKSERTSAEIDSMRRWFERNRGLDFVRTTLLASDTPAGRWTAGMMRSLLPRVGGTGEIEIVTVPRLSTENMRCGLVEFVREAARAIKRTRDAGRAPVVNATAGFKAETALLALVAAVLGAETIYLHEEMQDFVAFPPLPLRWDLDQHELRALVRLGGASSRDEARDLLPPLRERIWPFVERVGTGPEEVWGLTALGELLVESVAEPAEETPPSPRQGPFKLVQASGERGHAPDDIQTLGDSIGAKLPFAVQARVDGWKARGEPGILLDRPEDRERRVLRLQLRARDGRNVLFTVQTTARTDGEWDTARQLAARAFGRVSVVSELADEAVESQGHAVVELRALDVETQAARLALSAQDARRQLAAQLQEAHRQAKDLEKHIAQEREKVQRRDDEIASLRRRIRTQEDRIVTLEDRIAKQKVEIDKLRRQLKAPKWPGRTPKPRSVSTPATATEDGAAAPAAVRPGPRRRRVALEQRPERRQILRQVEDRQRRRARLGRQPDVELVAA